MSQNKVPKSENILTASCEKKRAIFSVPKKMPEMLEFLHKYAKLCSLCLRLASKLGSCRQNKMDAFFDVQRRLKDSSRDVRLGALATLQQLEQAATLAELADDVAEMLFGLIDGALPRGALAGAAVAARRAERGAKRWEYTTPRAPPRAHFRRPLRPHQARARRGGPLGNCAARRRHRPAGSAGPSAQVERRGAR